MARRKRRPIALRALNSLCVIALVVSIGWVFAEGFRLASSLVLTVAILAVAGPVVVASDGLVEVLTGLLEALVDGVVAILEAIASLFSGLS